VVVELANKRCRGDRDQPVHHVAARMPEVACRKLRTFRMPMSKPHVLGNPPVWLHNGTYREL